MVSTKKPIFRDLNADDGDQETTEIESLCMNCHANGTTRLLLTKIPFYKEVIIMSFACEECGYRNNEMQSSGQISDKGIRYSLIVDTMEDLNRQVVKSDYTSIKIVEIDFEIPARSQKGEVTTIEGVIDRSITALEQDQNVRRVNEPEVADQIDDFIGKLKKLKTLEMSFTLVLEDISGNAYVENPNAPQSDPKCAIHSFIRTPEQNRDLGIFSKNEVPDGDGLLHPVTENEYPLDALDSEVLQFRTNCNNCASPCETNMKLINIPHFKEVVIMASVCESCGNRTNEVKSGSGVEPHGLHMEVEVCSKDDFSRDVLKSETCSLKIPQLDLEVGPWALGGKFTTVEGLLTAVKDQLNDPKQYHMVGDSQDHEKKDKLGEFIKKFDEILEGRKIVTLVLDDPAGNSYIQSLSEGNTPDDALRISHYERSFEQNEELGLNDMKTENYET